MATRLDLVNKRAGIINKVDAKLKTVNAHATTPLTLDEVDVDLEDISKWSTKYDELQDKIIEACKDDAERTVEYDAALAFEVKLRDSRSKLRKIRTELSKATPSTTGTGNTGSGSATADIRLPKLDLPTFSGDYVDWTSFHDQYVAVIHDNTKLSGSQKLQYLKGSLKGKPAELLQTYAVNDANYDIAWDELKDRYENKRHIIKSHLDKLFAQKPLTSRSVSGLRQLLDTTTKHERALEIHKANTWDYALANLLIQNMDPESREQFSIQYPGTDYPKYDDLKTFIKDRCNSLEDVLESQPNYANSPRRPQGNLRRSARAHHTATHSPGRNSDAKCPICNSQHGIYKCLDFVNGSVSQRKDLIRQNRLCYNCLAPGHSIRQCPSNSTCRRCNAKHHTMIHEEKSESSSSSNSPATTVASHYSGSGVQVLLSTAVVKVKDTTGKPFSCRALLDNGSQASFVTESLAKLLGVKRTQSNVHVKGVGESNTDKARGIAELQLESSTSDYKLNLKFIILPKLTGLIPNDHINRRWPHIEGLQLADPDFNKPGKVDILLGADVYNKIIKGGNILYGDQPSVQDSHFGWIVSGPVKPDPRTTDSTVFAHVSLINVQDQLAKFFEIEELAAAAPNLTADEKACEAHFASTHSRDNTGRYMVALPFKENSPALGTSKEQAIRRFNQVERRLDRNQHHRKEYNKFMEEYIRLGHMELIPQQQRQETKGKTFYLPHHFVLKETSTSTKFRVVFDGSAQSTSGVSLNDKLHIGPRLQRDIMDILMRFRQYKYGITADIAKFFRQFKMKPEDCDFQRIVWRPSCHLPLEEYRLKTVTYGTASAPFLASRALNQLAQDEGHKHPIAKEVLERDVYVDDAMTGAHDVASALELQAQLIQILKSAQLPLLKWASNCPEVLQAVPEEHRETKLPLLMDTDDSVKALGLYWNPAGDHFFFKVTLDPAVKQVTKRTLLSDTAKLYDPLGFLAPVLINAKVMFQHLWKLDLSWDVPLPSELAEEWLELRTNLVKLQELKIRRHMINNKDSKHELHGFCDASQKAYAAVVYLRTQDPDGNVDVNIICSKTKVAPVKQQSIPRLELCGSVLLANLLQRVTNTLTINIASTTAWTDSTIVLDWLASHPQSWVTFVANRVSSVQALVDRSNWRYVPSKMNPADCATRGLSPSELLDFNLWWSVPWLKQDSNLWPQDYVRKSGAPILDQRALKVHTAQVDTFDLTSKYSSLVKLQRVTAYCIKFIRHCRLKKEDRAPFLTPTDLNQALMFWIKRVQAVEFATTISAIKNSKPLPKDLVALCPFLDPQDLLRVGGRIDNAKMSFDRKHPILLPARHALTTLVIRSTHLTLLHGGGRLTQASLLKHFWIINATNQIRKCIRQCVRCFRHHAQTMQQQMGNLPRSRLEPARAFLRTGVDFGGPFNLKSMSGRGGKVYKAYLALFICFTTKAVHLELVSELTSEAFIASLRRFIARRGKPTDMSSDNGGNFVGANRELQLLLKQFKTQQHNQLVTEFLSTQGIKWHFIPPKAPHVGGLWEAGIKSAKQHMKKIIGDTILSYEEMTTILHQIEACLNSRPITPLSSDPNDLQALTPGHFLIGDALTSFPEPDVTHLKMNRLSRYQLLQHQLQSFWKRWHHEYLSTLQQRTKWTSDEDSIAIGDMVLIKEDNMPPLQWLMARVTDTNPGDDSRIRVVTVQTQHGSFKRDIRKLCKLPIELC